jgi:hypothetical protein
VLFFPRVLVEFIRLKGGATHHVGGRRRIQVRLDAVSQCMQLLTQHPQFTGKTRGWFPFGDAA